MARYQSRALRTVLGAYKAAPIRSLGLDAFCSLLDIYLRKRVAEAEGSALCQARTEKIGLQGFLFRLNVPGVVSPSCPCGRGDQTAVHLFAECVDDRSRMLRVFGYVTKEEVYRGLSHHNTAPDMARALVQSGWLP